MKPILTTTAIFSVLLTQAYANAEGPRIGAAIDYYEVMRSYELPDREVVDHYDAIGGSLLADWAYLRLSLGASHNFGNTITFAEGREEKDPGYKVGYLHLAASLKYPFRLSGGAIALWPAVGLRGDYNLSFDHEGSVDGVKDSAPHDLTAVAGGGLDYAIDSRIALTAALLGAYSLTPSLDAPATSPRIFGVSIQGGVLLTL